MTDSVRLTPDELNLALSFIEKNGASDFYPQPFEFDALRASWDKALPVLERVELLSYDPRPAVELIAPKQRYLVRPAHLLDPIDTILYAGLCFRLAPSIQRSRAYQNGLVHSFHFNPARGLPAENTFFSEWDQFEFAVRQRLTQCAFVGTADIVDFFPRIYLHRFQNAVTDASGDEYGTRALMRLVEGWAHGTSYGIPTGPLPSNFLAEALLIEVDQFLLSHGVTFVRWADDYVLFGGTAHEIQKALHHLGARLHTTQGLSLNPYKTRIRTVQQYVRDFVERDPTDELYERILDEVFGGNPYATVDFDDLGEDERAVLNEVDVVQLLEKSVEGDFIDIRAVRLVLKVLSAFGRMDLITPIVENLERLLPVSEAVGKFFGSLDSAEGSHGDVGKQLLSRASDGVFFPEFSLMWLLHPFTLSSKWNNTWQLRRIAREARNPMVRRQAILALGHIGNRSSLLDLKATLDDTRDWEQRAILYACRALPMDERKAIIDQMGGAGGEWNRNNVLERSVLRLLSTAP